MKCAIYCRVNTDNQEREGTSLQTQLEACFNYCQDKGYDVAYSFSELPEAEYQAVLWRDLLN